MSQDNKKKSHRVKARVSRGLRDLLPQQQLARQWMIDKIRGVYELYGFLPLSTPAVEYLDVLLGSEPGDEAQRSIFRVANPEDEELGLRFDLTVPLARVVAQYAELGRPFRRYQVAPVWRGDKPDKGRYREFTQFDLDSVGVTSEIADTPSSVGVVGRWPASRARYPSTSARESFALSPGVSQCHRPTYSTAKVMARISRKRSRMRCVSGDQLRCSSSNALMRSGSSSCIQ